MINSSRTLWVMLTLATGGFFVAFYLTVEHFLGQVPVCSFLSGCEVVTTSEYATIFGIPISLLGAAYFLAVWASLLAFMQTKRKELLLGAGAFISVGAVVALILLYLQFFVLEAVCIYCATSDTISLLLGGLFALYWIQQRKA